MVRVNGRKTRKKIRAAPGVPPPAGRPGPARPLTATARRPRDATGKRPARPPRDVPPAGAAGAPAAGHGRYEEALALYRTLLELDPDSALTHSNVGAALYHLDRPQEALQSVERALALDPDLEVARTGLAEVRKLLNQRGP